MTTLRPFAAGMFAPMRNADRLVAMKQSLDDLQRQLGTGRKADTLSGLGAGRTTSLSVRASLAENASFRSIIQRAGTRAGLMSNALDQIGRIGAEARKEATAELAAGSAIPPAAVQNSARARLDAVVAALNEDFDGQYLFAGGDAQTRPVLSVAEMLGGNATAAGLNQMIDERRQADLGDGLGRLTLARSGSTVTLSETVGLPFGLKLGTVANGLGNTTASIGGAPPALTVSFAGQPQPGEKIELVFTMPDGSSERMTMTARASASAAATGSFAIGADASATAANVTAALDSSLRDFAATKLAAASAISAAQDFFAGSATQPPRRVDGPPFDTATGFAAPGSRPTVLWYQGEDGPADPRATQSVHVDRGLHLAVGARANEAPFRRILAGLAALAAGPLPQEGAYRAITERSATLVHAMNDADGREVTVEIGAARQHMAAAAERHKHTDAVLSAALGDVEEVSMEEISTRLVSLQTRLQASYQVTASIGQMKLADYLK